MGEDSNKRHKLQQLVKDKTVHLVCHWDADGVTSGAILYHLIKKHAKHIYTLSKGDVFSVFPEDVSDDAEIIICADIAPGEGLDLSKVVYIDHHPFEDTGKVLMALHDDAKQSCSLLIWEELLYDLSDPYLVFLTLLGYFGDGGSRESIPVELQVKANDLIPEMMRKNNSFFGNSYYYTIEKFVSALNTGKRLLWRGDVPLNLLIDIEHHEPFVKGRHQTAQLLETFKAELRNLYNMDIELKDSKDFTYALIECPANVQGVLCARYIKDKPIIVMNKVNGYVIGSMRVPDDKEFDAGKFLDKYNEKFETYLGGGHEKAGGFTIKDDEFDDFFGELTSNQEGG